MFLYRHALEIYIKAILVGFGGAVVSKEEVFKRQHRLVEQLADLNKVCASAGLQLSGNVTSMVQSWREYDPDGVSLRYPMKRAKQGASNFERVVFLDGESFDLKRFRDAVESVLDELDALFLDLQHEEYADLLRSEGLSK